METEAKGIGFEIDHYHPTAHGGAELDYDNLVYSCETCNGTKNDVWFPDPADRELGFRFWRPDREVFSDHAEVDLERFKLKHKTYLGDFSISELRLNREGLRGVRKARADLYESAVAVLEGVAVLRNMSVDQFKDKRDKARFQRVKAHALVRAAPASEEASQIVRDLARSPLLDAGDEARDQKQAFRKRNKETYKRKAKRKRRRSR